MTVNGYDISALQGNLTVAEFSTMKNNGVAFVIFRCYVGNDYQDGNFAANVANATAAGLQVAAYHFLYPLPGSSAHPNRDPVSQAKLHYAAAAAHGVTVACADLEWPTSTDWAAWGCSAAEIAQWTLTYLQTYSQLNGRPMVLYTYPDFAKSINMAAYPEFAQYPLWIASYQDTPDIPAPWTNWAMWQTSGGTGAKLPNSAPVDADVAKDLSLWGIAESTTLTVTPLQPLPDPNPVVAPIDVPQPVQAPPVTQIQTTSPFTFIDAIIDFVSRLFK
jgi:lysozyme